MFKLFAYFKSPAFFAGFFVFVVGGWGMVVSKRLLRTDQDLPRIPNLTPLAMKHFTFGFRDQVADILWLRSIQDFDYCEKNLAPQICVDQGWLYQMLDLMTELSPHFRMPLATGPLALTVIVNDIKGAGLLFDKAVRLFPADWPIVSRAAYHALYEERDKEKAAKLLKQAADHGGPTWYYMLATKLYSEAGQIAVAEALYHQIAEDPNTDPKLREAMAKRLEDLKKTAEQPPSR